eukprot:4585829-Pleurochrysis_carterae.AAC.2
MALPSDCPVFTWSFPHPALHRCQGLSSRSLWSSSGLFTAPTVVLPLQLLSSVSQSQKKRFTPLAEMPRS